MANINYEFGISELLPEEGNYLINGIKINRNKI